MTEKEQKIFDIQCETTKRLLLAQALRSPEEDMDYISKIRFTPIAIEAQCVKEDGSVDLNIREITTEEYDLHQNMRYKAGQRIAELRREATLSTLTEDKKERATTAFLRKFSLETIKDKFWSILGSLHTPTYAEKVAQALKKGL